MSMYPPSAVERAMKRQEVILRAMSGELTWIQAADIVDVTPRTLRRWRERWERWGYEGLWDRRTQRPSPQRIPVVTLERILRLYRDIYQGFNVRHFHAIAQREHGVTLSYSFVKKALQEAGLVRKGRQRGRHRKRRERRACFGEMLHLDGSRHRWLALVPELWLSLIVVLDDATSRILYAQFWGAERSEAILTALSEVVATCGIPQSLSTDRASWAFYTPQAGESVDKDRLTAVGQVLARLGVEHIPGYSPQARGRSERTNGTLQGRLVNELRVHAITTPEAANRYLREVFVPRYNDEFACAPRDPESAFVSAEGAELAQLFCTEHTRIVAKDNTVRIDGQFLQIDPQPGRTTCAGLKVTVRQHLSGECTVWWGRRLMGCYDAHSHPIPIQTALGGTLASGYALRSRAA